MEFKNCLLRICMFFIAVLNFITGEPCTFASDPCVCKTSTFEMNLKSLMDDRKGNDFSAGGDVDYIYYIQPCNRPLTTALSQCTAKTPDIVGCQVFQKSTENSYGLGVMNKFDATLTSKDNYILKNSYVDTDFYERTRDTPGSIGGRCDVDHNIHRALMMLLNINCAEQDTTFVYNGFSSSAPIIYNFTIASKLICSGGGGSSEGISVGSIMVIIFFVVLVLYLVGGLLFLKFVKKLKGQK